MDRNAFYNNLSLYSKNSLHSTSISNIKDSSKYDIYNYIQHYGVMGQKWGVRRYQNPDGSLTEEGKQRYLNPDGTLTKQAHKELKPDQQLKIRQEFYKKQSDEGTGEYADNAIYDENKQKEKLSNAKTKHMYDLDFVETIQNAENLSDDDINREYEAYLKNPRKYSEEFMVDGNGKITNSRSGITNVKPKNEMKDYEDAKTKQFENGKTEYEKELEKLIQKKGIVPPKEFEALKEKYSNKQESDADIEKRQLDLYKKKMEETLDKKGHITPDDMARWNKEIEEETGHKIKTGQEKAKEEKAAKKEEKKKIKAAKKEVEKNLKGGIISNWALLNKAMEEAGITDTKNMTAADWNKVNEEIQRIRNK